MSVAARRAEALIGTPFRLQGRDPAIALDCVGLALEAFELPHSSAPRHYGWHRHDLQELDRRLTSFFEELPASNMRSGDMLVMRCGTDRYHLGIAGSAGLIHADAAIGRTVCRPWPAPWPIARIYRPKRRG